MADELIWTLADTEEVWVSMVNGVSPPLAHIDEDCLAHRGVALTRVPTSWHHAKRAGCRLCSKCATRWSRVDADFAHNQRPVRIDPALPVGRSVGRSDRSSRGVDSVDNPRVEPAASDSSVGATLMRMNDVLTDGHFGEPLTRGRPRPTRGYPRP